MLKPSKQEFIALAKKGTIVPVYGEILADLETPVSTFLKLADGKPYAYLLESVEGGERWGRYSFMAWEPKLIFQSKGSMYSLHKPGDKPAWQKTDDPIVELHEIMKRYTPVQIEGLPPFWGGAVGYFGYDMVRFIEHLPNKPKDTMQLPDSTFMITDTIVIFDHLKHSVKIVVCADVDGKEPGNVYAEAGKAIEGIIAKLRKPFVPKKSKKNRTYPLLSNMTEKKFEENVRAGQRYIRNGDIIQVVLSQRLMRKTDAKPFDIYRSLRQVNPSPYMFYLQLGSFELVGSSPEILVRKEGLQAQTRPIAGTAPRAKDPEAEEQVAKDLLADPKERAEHIMLVDLGRNDLGRVCEPATVKVPNLMCIEKYSHVMHIVSYVTGTLRPGAGPFELFRACFPAGTLSGAPKVRAMEIIDELEEGARGTYGGSVGYFSYSGNMDMAITIRTMLVKDGTAYVQAGAGIVADSVPKKEYLESRNKAAALFAAIDKAEEGL